LGNFTEAVKAWQTAAQQYHTQGDRINEALSLSYLSLAQQELNSWEAASQSIEQSLKLLQTTKPAADPILWAQVLNSQANLQLHKGKAEIALENWQQAQKYYEQAGDKVGSLGSQINQAQALQSLGFYRRAKQQLQGRLAEFKLLLYYDKPELAAPLAPQLLQQLGELPPSHSSLYAAINFAATINQLKNPEKIIP
jgi:tetratricopeptide (TPR) repeat protein